MDLLRLKPPVQGDTRLALAPEGKAHIDDLVILEDSGYPYFVISTGPISEKAQNILAKELGDDLSMVSYVFTQSWEAGAV